MDKTVVVPVSATPEIVAAVQKWGKSEALSLTEWFVEKLYSTIIAAAPAPAAQDEREEWHSPLKTMPDDGEVVTCLLQHIGTRSIQQVELLRSDEDDVDWRTTDDGSEPSYDWSVIAWKRRAALTAPQDAQARDKPKNDVSDYHAIFTSIADAITWRPHSTTEISVQAFEDALAKFGRKVVLTTAQPADKPEGCCVNEFSSRVCERGTKSCTVTHSEGKVEQQAEPEGLTSKEAWWAGYRAGKGLPPDTPRKDAIAAQPQQLTDEEIQTAVTKLMREVGFGTSIEDITYEGGFDFSVQELRSFCLRFARALLSAQKK